MSYVYTPKDFKQLAASEQQKVIEWRAIARGRGRMLTPSPAGVYRGRHLEDRGLRGRPDSRAGNPTSLRRYAATPPSPAMALSFAYSSGETGRRTSLVAGMRFFRLGITGDANQNHYSKEISGCHYKSWTGL